MRRGRASFSKSRTSKPARCGGEGAAGANDSRTNHHDALRLNGLRRILCHELNAPARRSTPKSRSACARHVGWPPAASGQNISAEQRSRLQRSFGQFAKQHSASAEDREQWPRFELASAEFASLGIARRSAGCAVGHVGALFETARARTDQQTGCGDSAALALGLCCGFPSLTYLVEETVSGRGPRSKRREVPSLMDSTSGSEVGSGSYLSVNPAKERCPAMRLAAHTQIMGSTGSRSGRLAHCLRGKDRGLLPLPCARRGRACAARANLAHNTLTS